MPYVFIKNQDAFGEKVKIRINQSNFDLNFNVNNIILTKSSSIISTHKTFSYQKAYFEYEKKKSEIKSQKIIST